MKIEKLAYHNKALDWRLDPTEFSKLNLLVGASGVGKTRILEAILDLQKIASGKLTQAVTWEVEFSVDDVEYCWAGEFEHTRKEQDSIYINIPMAHWKIVTRKGSLVTVRDANKFKLGKSKHEAFMQLMQLEEFTQGIAIE